MYRWRFLQLKFFGANFREVSIDAVEQKAIIFRIKSHLDGIQAKLPGFQKFCKTSETVNAQRINVAYETFIPLLSTYETAIDHLLQLCSDEDEREGAVCQLQVFQSDWAKTLSLFDMSVITSSDDKPSDNANNQHRRVNTTSQVKLPKLKLPKFNGEPTS